MSQAITRHDLASNIYGSHKSTQKVKIFSACFSALWKWRRLGGEIRLTSSCFTSLSLLRDPPASSLQGDTMYKTWDGILGQHQLHHPQFSKLSKSIPHWVVDVTFTFNLKTRFVSPIILSKHWPFKEGQNNSIVKTQSRAFSICQKKKLVSPNFWWNLHTECDLEKLFIFGNMFPREKTIKEILTYFAFAEISKKTRCTKLVKYRKCNVHCWLCLD